jgi:hypothetical protein
VRENFVLNALINFEPVKRLENSRNVMRFRSFDDKLTSRTSAFIKVADAYFEKVEDSVDKNYNIVKFRTNRGSTK